MTDTYCCPKCGTVTLALTGGPVFPPPRDPWAFPYPEIVATLSRDLQEKKNEIDSLNANLAECRADIVRAVNQAARLSQDSAASHRILSNLGVPTECADTHGEMPWKNRALSLIERVQWLGDECAMLKRKAEEPKTEGNSIRIHEGELQILNPDSVVLYGFGKAYLQDTLRMFADDASAASHLTDKLGPLATGLVVSGDHVRQLRNGPRTYEFAVAATDLLTDVPRAMVAAFNALHGHAITDEVLAKIPERYRHMFKETHE
jgi:hypothetical protein